MYLTEGYTDVIALHKIGLINSVATLGTGLSDSHLKQLAKHCKRVNILRDGDDAGMKAALHDMEMILQHGLQAGYVLLPDGIDPYDLVKSSEIDDPLDWLKENRTDALLYFSKKVHNEANDPTAKSDAVTKIASWLSLIADNIIRKEYEKQIRKECKLTAKDLKERITEPTEREPSQSLSKTDWSFSLPDGITPEEVMKHGFYPLIDGENTGYYFIEGEGRFRKLSNFVMTPLFHKNEMEDNTRVFKIENGITPIEIVEMPSSALISIDPFRKFLYDKGSYFFHGKNSHLDKLTLKYLFEFPKAFELKTLGWQNEGFFAFYNCVYNGHLSNYDDAGLIKHNNHYYFSPAASTIYSDMRKSDDLFENDKYLEYNESPISFEEWMQLMVAVYEDHAYSIIAYVFVSIFRDIVFKVDHNCPHLYFYGQTMAGKSKSAESLMNIFFKEMPAFQLNGGTDFAFANRLERFRNVPVFLNEFDEGTVKDEWFQMIKGAYDGEGRERGRGGSKRKTEIQKINACLVLVGQYLNTKDDNSIVSRSIIEVFSRNDNRSDEQMEAYNRLKSIESQGISSLITGLLKHRDRIEEAYYSTFYEQFKNLSSVMRARKLHFDDRVLRNYTSIYTMVVLFEDQFDFPWKIEDYKEWVIDRIVSLSALMSQSDVLADFWDYVSSMIDHGEVIEGRDFKIVNRDKVRLTKGKEDHTIDLGESKDLLYIRLKEVSISYSQEKRKSGGSPIDFTSLKTYMENRNYYLGFVGKERIGQKAVSCYVLDYKALGVVLHNETGNVDNSIETLQSEVRSASGLEVNDDDLPF